MYSKKLEHVLNKEWVRLVDLDLSLFQFLIAELGIDVRTVLSSELAMKESNKQLRLVEMCRMLDCDSFYEGKCGQNYIDAEVFKAHGITVEFQEYKHPYYDQLWMCEQGFISHLSIIDLLFNHGPDSLDVLTGRKVIPTPEGVQFRGANDL